MKTETTNLLLFFLFLFLSSSPPHNIYIPFTALSSVVKKSDRHTLLHYTHT